MCVRTTNVPLILILWNAGKIFQLWFNQKAFVSSPAVRTIRKPCSQAKTGQSFLDMAAPSFSWFPQTLLETSSIEDWRFFLPRPTIRRSPGNREPDRLENLPRGWRSVARQNRREPMRRLLGNRSGRNLEWVERLLEDRSARFILFYFIWNQKNSSVMNVWNVFRQYRRCTHRVFAVSLKFWFSEKSLVGITLYGIIVLN